jgi:uncharacterized protein (DUF58 family)
MRALIWVGWLMVALGAAMLAGSIAAGFALFGVMMLATLAGSGVFMILLARGWDRPLESPEDLHRYGRPANATVRRVEDPKLDAGGSRTAKLSLYVTPRNESAYKTQRRVVLPGGRIPAEGETVTIKFDPHKRREFVLLAESYEVADGAQRALARLRA